MNPHRPRIVKIAWFDSCGIVPIWENRDAIESLPPVLNCSVGYLWESTKDHVTIAQSLHRDQIGRRFTIPRGCIHKMKTVAR